MSTESTEITHARFVNTIHFHGLNVAVLNAGGIDYIPARPLCELAGLDWKGAKRSLHRPDKVYLYDLKRLIPPHIEGLGGLKSPQEGAALTALIYEELAALGLSTDSADDKQAALPFNTVQATA